MPATFSLAYTRAQANLPLLQALHPDVDQALLLSGLQELAARLPALKEAGALARRAAHENDKYNWAFPDDALASSSITRVAEHGFSHHAAIVARLRSRLPDPPESLDRAAFDKLVARSFRAAVKARKRNAAINIEREALKRARTALADGGDARTDLVYGMYHE